MRPGITPNLWFDTEAEQAAEFYTSLFPNSRTGSGSPPTAATRARAAGARTGSAIAALREAADGVPAG